MAKPATRMKSIVLQSYIESQTRRLAGSTPPLSPFVEHTQHDEPQERAGLNVCCEEPTQGIAPVSCSPALRDDLRAAIEDMVIPRLVIRQSLPSDETTHMRHRRVLPTPVEIDLLARIAAQPDLTHALDLARNAAAWSRPSSWPDLTLAASGARGPAARSPPAFSPYASRVSLQPSMCDVSRALSSAKR